MSLFCSRKETEKVQGSESAIIKYYMKVFSNLTMGKLKCSRNEECIVKLCRKSNTKIMTEKLK